METLVGWQPHKIVVVHSVLVRREVAWDGELTQRRCCWTLTGSAFQGLRTMGTLYPSIAVFIMAGLSATYFVQVSILS